MNTVTKPQLMSSAEFRVANNDHFVGNIYWRDDDAKKYGDIQREEEVQEPDAIVIEGVELTEPWIIPAAADNSWGKPVNRESSSSSTCQSARSPTNVALSTP